MVLWLLLLSCSGGPDKAGSPDTGGSAEDGADGADGADGSDGTDGTDGTDATPWEGEPPCTDGGWGWIDAPEDALHVRADGDDATATGAGGAPFATVAAALEAWRGGAGQSLAVGPGEFTVNLSLSGDRGGGASDDGVRIEGCGHSETVFRSAEDTEGESLLQYTGVDGAVLRGLLLDGGYRTLRAGASTTLRVESVVLDSPERSGVVAVGDDTFVELFDVEIRDPVALPDFAGDFAAYGISATLSNISMEGGGITGGVGAGILADGAALDLVDVSVAQVQASADGEFGRGIQLQGFSVASLDTVVVRDVVDAGVFSMQSTSLVLQDVTVEGVGAGSVEGVADVSGDGLVVSQGAPDDAIYDPSTFVTSILGTTASGNDRAGMLLVDVEVVDLRGNTAGAGNGYTAEGTSILLQGAATVTDGSADAYADLTTLGLSPLDLNWTILIPEAGE